MTANPDLGRHPLRRRILATLEQELSLSELAASLRVTDARLLCAALGGAGRRRRRLGA
jgi:hypothetical protein